MFADNFFSKCMISVEAEDVSGRTHAEIERVIYAKVKNFDFLDNANGAERQEQWSVKIEKNEENQGSGTIRVRKSLDLRAEGSKPQYILTTKLDVGEKGSNAENNEASTKDMFRLFQYLASKGMVKDRYYFDIPDTDNRFEVDCFPNPDTMYPLWVKIDLENWPRGKALPALPFEFEEMMDGTAGEVSEENEGKIKELYETIFLKANEMQPLVEYDNDPDQSTDEDGQTATNTTTNDGADSGQDDNDGGTGSGDGENGSEDDGADQPAGTSSKEASSDDNAGPTE